MDDPEAATQKTVTVWVSRHNRICQDEHCARYDGATHRACEQCGQPIEKHWLICSDCRQKNEKAKYKAMPFKEWDRKAPLCIFGDDTYFFGEDDIEFYCEEHGCKEEDLELVICEPYKMPVLESDFFEDCMPDDCDADLPDVLADAIDQFNEIVQKQEPLSWYPGKSRTSCAKAKGGCANHLVLP